MCSEPSSARWSRRLPGSCNRCDRRRGRADPRRGWVQLSRIVRLFADSRHSQLWMPGSTFEAVAG
ncbi:hypothetical protein ACFPRL_28390 [Pseudoclavibacter helvolus]